MNIFQFIQQRDDDQKQTNTFNNKRRRKLKRNMFDRMKNFHREELLSINDRGNTPIIESCLLRKFNIATFIIKLGDEYEIDAVQFEHKYKEGLNLLAILFDTEYINNPTSNELLNILIKRPKRKHTQLRARHNAFA
jgi:hypothetical protein